MSELARMRASQRRLLAVLLVAAAALSGAGCGDEQASPAAPAVPAPQNTTLGAGSGSGNLLSDAVLDAMNDGIQDEYHAELTYMKVIEKFGEVQPFSNIVSAEERHSEAIARLFVNYDLPVPPSLWNLDNVPEFATLTDACAGGVAAELDNIALYDDLLTRDLPQDVRNVFTNIRAASLENHLPAFQACCACSR